MPAPDIKFRTYLKAFFADILTGMSGPLSVPFAALALWVSSRSQKILWGCLAAVCAVVASFRVWRKERIDRNEQLETLRSAKDRDIRALAVEKDQEIAALHQRLDESDGTISAHNRRIAELSRNPFSEDLERTVRQALDRMTHMGHLLMRHLLMNQPIEVGRPFMREIPLDRQIEQMGIALESGIVRLDEKRQGAMVWTYYVVNPQHQPVLQKVLYDVLQ